MTRLVRSLLIVPALAVGAGLASCSDDAETSPWMSPSMSMVQVEGAWARTSPMMVSMGAAYFEITSPVDDRLMAVSVDPSIAAEVEIHETVPAETDAAHGDMQHGEMDHGEMDHGEMPMTMREMASGLALPAGETVMLKPGGYHLMLVDLVKPLESGEQFDVVLTLESAGDVPVTVEVRDEAPTAP